MAGIALIMLTPASVLSALFASASAHANDESSAAAET